MRGPGFGVATFAFALMACAAVARPAQAAETGQIGTSPWFPFVASPEAAQETYELNTLGIVRVGDESWRADRGKYRALVSRHDFYVTVGRTDLARHEAASAATSSILFWSGFAVVAAGAIMFYAHASPGGADPGVAPVLIAACGGLGAMYLSSFFTGPSVSQAEAEEMSQRYNARLKQQIEQELPASSPRPVQARAPRVLPWTDGRSGGGLMAVASF